MFDQPLLIISTVVALSQNTSWVKLIENSEFGIVKIRYYFTFVVQQLPFKVGKSANTERKYKTVIT